MTATAERRVQRRIALLPTGAGLAAVAATVLAPAVLGVTTEPTASNLTAGAALLVALTVVTGHAVGLYAGLGLLVVAQRLAAPPSTAALAGYVVALVVVHEMTRFSLDARRPTRFGPGVLWRAGARSLVLAAGAAAMTALTPTLTGLALPPVLMAVGLAAVAVPLVARRAVSSAPASAAGRGTVVVAAAAALAVVGLVALGAQARTGVETSGEHDPFTPPTTIEVDADDRPALPPGSSAPTEVPTRAVVVGAFVLLLVIIAILVALRRPEVLFGLDDPELDESFGGLEIVAPSATEATEHDLAMDERDAADLLDELLLDVTGEPDPGRAVRYGYATVERGLARAGIERAADETEREFLSRAIPALGDVGDGLVELTRTFERARFSPEVVTEEMRSRAVTAVTEVRAALTQDQPSDPGPNQERAPGPDLARKSGNGS